MHPIANSWVAIGCDDERAGKPDVKLKYRFGRQKNMAHPCYSVSKSIVALACGFLFDKGMLFPGDPVAKYLKEYFPADVDKKWFDVTLADLFRHKTGARDGIDLDIEQAPTGEVLTALFSSPIIGKTGESWNYSDGNYYILARVFEKVSGVTAEEYLNKNFFIPTGFYYNSWAKDHYGHLLGGTGLFLRTEDMLKVGSLILNKGVYDGKRYLSEKWIDFCTKTNDTKKDNYGFGIRSHGKDVFTITGMNGQGIFIDRNKKFVVAWHSQRSSKALSVCFLLHKIGLL